jgi:O-antigen biosynthesis protein
MEAINHSPAKNGFLNNPARKHDGFERLSLPLENRVDDQSEWDLANARVGAERGTSESMSLVSRLKEIARTAAPPGTRRRMYLRKTRIALSFLRRVSRPSYVAGKAKSALRRGTSKSTLVAGSFRQLAIRLFEQVDIRHGKSKATLVAGSFRQLAQRLFEQVDIRHGKSKATFIAGSFRQLAKRLLQQVDIELKQLDIDLDIFLNSPSFPTVDNVTTSIVIPAYNNYRETYKCLKSISTATDLKNIEVIIIDDTSTDRTPRMLKRIAGAVVLRNERNMGFIRTCNRGADVARGQYLVFLNNDTVVTSGWLEALVATFEDYPDAGVVGAKLVYPDGRLQEAGGVIWNDASGWNYGKFDDPDHPRYNFVRDTDYCTGACMMIPRMLFKQLGGFDTHFAPIYYEDTDLAFKARHAGHRVIYQPLSRVIHFEGLTSGTDVRFGLKTHQVTNQTKFRTRWQSRLRLHPDSPTSPVRIVRDHGPGVQAPGNVLVIDHRLPTPDRDAGSVRMFEMMRLIRQRHFHVTFIPGNLLAQSPYKENLQRNGIEVIHHPYYCSVGEYLEQHGGEFDLVIMSRAEVAARHFVAVKTHAPNAKIVYDTVDLHHLRGEREAAITGKKEVSRVAAFLERQELWLARNCDVTLVVSPIEKTILEAKCPGIDARIIPTIVAVDDRQIPGFDSRSNIVFIGGFEHPPNVDAVLYFCREIMPRIRQELSGVVFQVIGPDAPAEVLGLASDDIQILGHVHDVRPIFDQARISVAPLRFGAGVKGKVNLTMSLGVPAVLSSIAAEGMYLSDGENVLIADEPASFADSVIRLYRSRELWERLSEQGQRNVREHFSIEAAAERIDSLMTLVTPAAPHRHVEDHEP